MQIGSGPRRWQCTLRRSAGPKWNPCTRLLCSSLGREHGRGTTDDEIRTADAAARVAIMFGGVSAVTFGPSRAFGGPDLS